MLQVDKIYHCSFEDLFPANQYLLCLISFSGGKKTGFGDKYSWNTLIDNTADSLIKQACTCEHVLKQKFVQASKLTLACIPRAGKIL